MTVPTLITDLSTVAASNSPAGSDAVFPDLDNFIRALSAFIAQLNANKANLASPTFTGTVTIPTVSATTVSSGTHSIDANYLLSLLSSNPLIQFDTGDYISYDRTNNKISFGVGGTDRATIDATDGPQRSTDASTANGLVRKSQMDTADGLRCLKTNNLSDVANTATALSNLGGLASSSFTGSNQSLSGSGYQKFPGGLIIQWGTVAPNSGVAFAIPFPTACVSLQLTSTPVAGGGYPVVTGIANTGFNQSNNNNAYYLAIGY